MIAHKYLVKPNIGCSLDVVFPFAEASGWILLLVYGCSSGLFFVELFGCSGRELEFADEVDYARWPRSMC